jgi:hypothetical protein
MEITEGGERMILGANFWPPGKGVSLKGDLSNT